MAVPARVPLVQTAQLTVASAHSTHGYPSAAAFAIASADAFMSYDGTFLAELPRPFLQSSRTSRAAPSA